MCVCETKVERDFVRAPEVRWNLGFMHESAETGFRGLLETASQTGDAVEIVPLTSCGSCGGCRTQMGSPPGSLKLRPAGRAAPPPGSGIHRGPAKAEHPSRERNRMLTLTGFTGYRFHRFQHDLARRPSAPEETLSETSRSMPCPTSDFQSALASFECSSCAEHTRE